MHIKSITKLIKSQKLDFNNIEHGFYSKNYQPANKNKFISLKQIHSNKVVIYNVGDDVDKQPADAIVTRAKNIAIAVYTADCVPLILCDNINNIIAVAHAGWRGAFAGIVQNTITAMLSIGAQTANIAAALMPAITQASYEVDAKFYEKFIEQKQTNNKFFKTGRKGHYQFDLKAYVVEQLYREGVNMVDVVDIDSFADQQNCYSYRRACLTGEGNEGRHISFIKQL